MRGKGLWGTDFLISHVDFLLISRRFHNYLDHDRFYVCGTITYMTYRLQIKFFNPSSAGDFACSAGELEIGSESWSLQPKAGDLACMKMLCKKGQCSLITAVSSRISRQCLDHRNNRYGMCTRSQIMSPIFFTLQPL